MRIPAADLERLVTGATADRLQDNSVMQRWISKHIPIGEVPARLKALSALATAISDVKQNHSEQIRLIVERVTVSKASLQIQLSESGLFQAIDIPKNGAELTCQADA